MNKENDKKGFTLSELLIVVAIIAVLVAISIPIFSSQLEKSRRAVDMANARNIIGALSTGMNDGSIEFGSDTIDGKKTCVAVIVGQDDMKFSLVVQQKLMAKYGIQQVKGILD